MVRSARSSSALLAAALALAACQTPAPREGLPACRGGGITIDTNFWGAGLHRCVVAANGDVVVNVDHEPATVEGINPSPWYAFRVWSRDARKLALTLDYTDYEHRYAPLTSRDGQAWSPLPAERLVLNEKKSRATLQLDLAEGTTWIAAQPIVTANAGVRWMRQAVGGKGFREEIYGRSLRGHALSGFVWDGPPGGDMIVALTRQHPPETTGQDAFRGFVEQITGRQDEAAKAFRAKHRILLVPMPNPDGVDGGHWRLNAGGVDLNRDWGKFTQPETKALSDFILKEAAGRRVVSMMDFHSTFRTVIYAPPLDAPSPTVGLLPVLKTALDVVAEPDLPWTYSHSPDGGTSKGWALEALKAPGLTMEFSDDIPAAQARDIGKAAADALIAYFPG